MANNIKLCDIYYSNDKIKDKTVWKLMGRSDGYNKTSPSESIVLLK